MAKNSATTAQTAAAVAAQEEIKPEDIVQEQPKAAAPRRSITNWMALVRSKLAPKVFKTRQYPPYFRIDGACHTTLIPSSEKIISKVNEYVGRGEDLGVDFTFVQIRQGWPGWAKLQEAGIEIKDLTCGTCQRQVPVHPGHLLKHMKRHRNPVTGKDQPGGRFLIALGKEGRVVSEEEALIEDLPNEFTDFEIAETE